MDFDSLARATKRLSDPKEIERLIIEAAKPYEAEIIDLNQSQLEVGKLSDGSNTPEYSNPEYAKMKKAQGSKSGNNFDYKLDGDFYQGFKLDFETTSINFDSTDSKTGKLTNSPFGSDNVFGLTEKNKGEAGELIQNDLIKLMQNEISR